MVVTWATRLLRVNLFSELGHYAARRDPVDDQTASGRIDFQIPSVERGYSLSLFSSRCSGAPWSRHVHHGLVTKLERMSGLSDATKRNTIAVGFWSRFFNFCGSFNFPCNTSWYLWLRFDPLNETEVSMQCWVLGGAERRKPWHKWKIVLKSGRL
jgi:hypothetical protein